LVHTCFVIVLFFIFTKYCGFPWPLLCLFHNLLQAQTGLPISLRPLDRKDYIVFDAYFGQSVQNKENHNNRKKDYQGFLRMNTLFPVLNAAHLSPPFVCVCVYVCMCVCVYVCIIALTGPFWSARGWPATATAGVLRAPVTAEPFRWGLPFHQRGQEEEGRPRPVGQRELQELRVELGEPRGLGEASIG